MLLGKRAVITMLLGILAGCNTEGMDKKNALEGLRIGSFEGIFENHQNETRLSFLEGVMTYHTLDGDVKREFGFQGDKIVIYMSSSARETRADLVMSVHGDQELLVCNSCGIYLMSNRWVRVE
ncbi:hypothetical protein F0231_01215 [Vibrio sp. RE86]|uniref:hypothetical protein n=1 Tax=Vibrio sp. RE86 TaxID=2607605 RepID=UPI001493D949|nr:hypothetical protein [Vibrio sp. RE86]NOH78354.1 hypothetical protein [Vibrio sp. RE86]